MDFLESLEDLSVQIRGDRSRIRHRIAMASDFYYPSVGGVEAHIFQLAMSLIKRGHKVIVVTKDYGDRRGVRWMSIGLKVYYIPKVEIAGKSTLATEWNSLPILRNILIRERITIVHGHQEMSSFSHELCSTARDLGLRAIFTYHSLFGMSSIHTIPLNKGILYSMSEMNHVICVSNTTKENAVLRTCLSPHMVSVIPNAIDHLQFVPDPSQRDPNYITIVVISRLAYRKGTDLLVHVIPTVCAANPMVKFIIGGDGPKRLVLEEMIEANNLQDRVELLGFVQHHKVRDVLVKGHIFLNTSLTESFCIAIVEALSCGLFTVSTRVGGVPEVVPSTMIRLTEPDPDDISEKLIESLEMYKDVDPFLFHRQVREMYNWDDIAQRTETVYNEVITQENKPLYERMKVRMRGGQYGGVLFVFVLIFRMVYFMFMDWVLPPSQIDIAPDFPLERYLERKEELRMRKFQM